MLNYQRVLSLYMFPSPNHAWQRYDSSNWQICLRWLENVEHMTQKDEDATNLNRTIHQQRYIGLYNQQEGWFIKDLDF